MGDYVDACIEELRQAGATGEVRRATSLFVGGGTPSRLPVADLVRLIRAVDLLPGAEVTVECNPESTTAELLAGLAGAGVTRVSLGAQSLIDSVLASLGRSHRPGAVGRAARLVAEARIPSFNLDLIYGAAAESDADWRATLRAVLALDPRPTHVSAYALTVERGTPLAGDPDRHPDDDVQAGRYETADDLLEAAGLSWYEISNWALPGHECRHNQLYWHGGEYKGIGCAAHSHLAGRRSWNLASPERYIRAVRDGRSPTAGAELLEGTPRALELLALALRTRTGVPSSAIADDPALSGLVERAGQQVILTRRGRLLANEVALRLLPAPPLPPVPAPQPC